MGITLTKNNDYLSLGGQRAVAVEEIYVGDSAPTEDKGYKAWIDTSAEAEAQELATKQYVDDAIANIEVSGSGSVDLTGYATESYVDEAIEKIELTPGPQGAQGEKGEPGADGYTPVKGVDYYTEAEKQALIEEILEQIPEGESLPASEEVEF